MRPVRIVRGDGAALALAGASEQGALDVVRSLRHRPVRATRVVDLEAVTATLPDDPARALWLAALELADAAKDLATLGPDDPELLDVVRERFADVVRAGTEVL